MEDSGPKWPSSKNSRGPLVKVYKLIFQQLFKIPTTFLPISSFVCSDTGTSPMYIPKNAPANVAKISDPWGLSVHNKTKHKIRKRKKN